MRVETRSTVAAPKKRKPLFGGKKTKAAAKPSAKQVLAKERAANVAQKPAKKSKKKLTKKGYTPKSTCAQEPHRI